MTETLFTQTLPADRYRARRDPVLQLANITVTFEGFRALNNLSLQIGVGELRCIIGPNGAGKTTLMDVITGKTRPDTGQVIYDQDKNLIALSPVEIARSGIGRKFQKPTVFEALTVFENLEIALKTTKTVWASLRARLDSAQRDRIDEILTLLQLSAARQRPAGLLSHGQKQFLEIGMLLVQEPHLLLLDEPAAGMTDAKLTTPQNCFAVWRASIHLWWLSTIWASWKPLPITSPFCIREPYWQKVPCARYRLTSRSLTFIWGAKCYRYLNCISIMAAATFCVACLLRLNRVKSPACSAATVWGKPRC